LQIQAVDVPQPASIVLTNFQSAVAINQADPLTALQRKRRTDQQGHSPKRKLRTERKINAISALS
jgi:hypothetical protein